MLTTFLRRVLVLAGRNGDNKKSRGATRRGGWEIAPVATCTLAWVAAGCQFCSGPRGLTAGPSVGRRCGSNEQKTCLKETICSRTTARACERRCSRQRPRSLISKAMSASRRLTTAADSSSQRNSTASLDPHTNVGGDTKP